MNLLFLPSALGLLFILTLSVAPILDMRHGRPLPGTMGTCRFGLLPNPPDPGPLPAHLQTLSYVESLGILLKGSTSSAHRAASHLVAAEVVKADPIPSPEECDAQMRQVYE